ncbi:MAG TPA: alpha/beta hydrolase [Ideonella sp.]|uniref:alpha/beta fold hydrolase n=1 Tax=Ideonella sp. TaxID=1929293 RepID=UPI002CCC7979|nr:alpha/beta hydrolase [Ideonella sp.]HSI47496.1 alpha/beta hydrolase [Ideonella sp.]
MQALRARLEAVLSVDASSALQQVAVPTLYLQATHDWVVPAAAGQRIRQLKADLQWASFDAPHFLLQTHSRQAAEAICSFARALMMSQTPGT